MECDVSPPDSSSGCGGAAAGSSQPGTRSPLGRSRPPQPKQQHLNLSSGSSISSSSNLNISATSSGGGGQRNLLNVSTSTSSSGSSYSTTVHSNHLVRSQQPQVIMHEEIAFPEVVSCTPESSFNFSDEYECNPLKEVDPLNVSGSSMDLLAATASPGKGQEKAAVKHGHHLRRNVPRIVVKQVPKQQMVATTAVESEKRPIGPASTMREVLASIPGFSVKPRRRSNKKMSTAAQIEQTKEGCIDLETPDSILVNTNLRSLLNKQTFQMLPPLFQYKLVQLLPSVDRPSVLDAGDCERNGCRLNPSSLNNEFFARACLEWRDRLSEGEFTPENQMKLRTEAEKEKSKLDPWKLKHFEPMWGDRGSSSAANVGAAGTGPNPSPPGTPTKDAATVVEPAPTKTSTPRPALKTTIKLRPTAAISTSTTATVVSPPEATASTSGSSNISFVNASTTTTINISSSSSNSSSTAPTTPTSSRATAALSPTATSSPKRVRTVGAVTRASSQAAKSPVTRVESPKPSTSSAVPSVTVSGVDLGPVLAAADTVDSSSSSSSSNSNPLIVSGALKRVHNRSLTPELSNSKISKSSDASDSSWTAPPVTVASVPTPEEPKPAPATPPTPACDIPAPEPEPESKVEEPASSDLLDDADLPTEPAIEEIPDDDPDVTEVIMENPGTPEPSEDVLLKYDEYSTSSSSSSAPNLKPQPPPPTSAVYDQQSGQLYNIVCVPSPALTPATSSSEVPLQPQQHPHPEHHQIYAQDSNSSSTSTTALMSYSDQVPPNALSSFENVLQNNEELVIRQRDISNDSSRSSEASSSQRTVSAEVNMNLTAYHHDHELLHQSVSGGGGAGGVGGEEEDDDEDDELNCDNNNHNDSTNEEGDDGEEGGTESRPRLILEGEEDEEGDGLHVDDDLHGLQLMAQQHQNHNHGQHHPVGMQQHQQHSVVAMEEPESGEEEEEEGDEDDDGDDDQMDEKFIDAENYVLESGEISTESEY
uniref:Polycomb protein Asx n=2 Tax=Culex pipiens TaxID=7175 RepID=A0A8D8BTD4_CULPI